jgi:hypothetical protein
VFTGRCAVAGAVGEVFARDCTEALGKMEKRMARERKEAGLAI